MATFATMAAERPPMRGQAAIGLTLAFGLVLAGFWPSFFADPARNDGPHILHGVFATAWFALLIGQATAVAARHHRLHMALGRWSPVLVGALLATSLAVVSAMLRTPTAALPPVVTAATPPDWAFVSGGGAPRDLRLVLVWIDLVSLVQFVLLYTLAMVARDRRDHGRWLVGTALIALIPALGRLLAGLLPELGGLPGALDPAFMVVEGLLALLIVRDLWAGKWRWPYPLTLAGFIGMQAMMWVAPAWPPFRALAGALGSAA